MVQLLGHIAMGLLFALPAWVLWDGRTAGAFVAFTVSTVTLPDLDIVLQNLGFPIKHHGAMHTVVFVVAVAAIVGLIATIVLRPVLRRWWQLTEDETVQRGTIYLFVTGGMILGGLSHLVADTLGADRYEPIEPLWPIVEEPVAIHIAHYSSPWLNAGLLVVAVGLHVGVILSQAFPIDHRYRRWRTERSRRDPAAQPPEDADRH